jgi:hypothetical protein
MVAEWMVCSMERSNHVACAQVTRGGLAGVAQYLRQHPSGNCVTVVWFLSRTTKPRDPAIKVAPEHECAAHAAQLA